MAVKNGQYNFDDAAKTAAQTAKHGNKGHKEANRPVAKIHELACNWISNTLNGLVDESPVEDKQYMPCYLKLVDLLPDL